MKKPFKTHYLILGLLALGCFGTSSTRAQEEIGDTVNEELQTSLSLKSVIQHTYANNPQIKAARAELLATQEQLPQALANWRPSLSAEANITSSDISAVVAHWHKPKSRNKPSHHNAPSSTRLSKA